MWPTRNNQPVQIDYGHDGSVLFLPDIDPNHPWQFAREQSGTRLYEIKNSKQSMIPPSKQTKEDEVENETQHEDGDENDYEKKNGQDQDRTEMMLNKPPLCITNDLLQYTSWEQKLLLSDIVYDPTIGRLFTLGSIPTSATTRNSSLPMIAYVSGERCSIVNISILKYGMGDTVYKKYSYEIQYPENINKQEVKSIELKLPIKQIEIFNSDRVSSTASPYIAIRTDLIVYILKVSYNVKERSIEVKLLEKIEISEVNNDNFSYISFNPFDFNMFSIIDVKGYWNIFQIKYQNNERNENNQPFHRSIFKKFNQSKNIYSPNDLSHWKKIIWGNDSNHLLISNRECLYSFDLSNDDDNDKQNGLILVLQTNKFSKIQDLIMQKNNSDFAFILTSMDLIWVNINIPIIPLLSWRHPLYDYDPSICLNSFDLNLKGNETTFVVIESQLHPLILIYQFSEINGLFKSINDPFYLISSDKNDKIVTSAYVTSTFMSLHDDEGFELDIDKDADDTDNDSTDSDDESTDSGNDGDDDEDDDSTNNEDESTSSDNFSDGNDNTDNNEGDNKDDNMDDNKDEIYFMYCIRMSKSLEITRINLSTVNGLEFENSFKLPNTTITDENNLFKARGKKTTNRESYYRTLFSRSSQPLSKHIQKDLDDIESFGKKLGLGLQFIGENFKQDNVILPFTEIGTPEYYISDLEELSSMLRPFRDHHERKGFSHIDFMNGAKYLFDIDECLHTPVMIMNQLNRLWIDVIPTQETEIETETEIENDRINEIRIIRQIHSKIIAVDLSFSYFGIYNGDGRDISPPQAMRNVIDLIPQSLKNFVSTWDEPIPNSVQTQSEGEESQYAESNYSSQAPTITLSQDEDTRSSQTPVIMSQIERGAFGGRKKKKIKKRGFA